MKKSVRLLCVVIALVMCVAVFAACGGNSNPSKEPEKTDSATPTLDAIKEKGKIVMLTNAAFAPYEYLGDNNEVVGIDADIAAKIAEELGVELEIVNMDFDAIITSIQSGNGDLGVAGITVDETRLQQVDFSINYVDAAQYMIVPKDSDIKTLADLDGKIIGVQQGTTGDLFASAPMGYEFDEDGNATKTATAKDIKRYKSGAEAAMDMVNGNLDAVIIDDKPADAIVAQYKDLVKIDEKLTEEQYAIAIGKDKQDLVDFVNQVLQSMIDDGSLAQITAKHVEATK